MAGDVWRASERMSEHKNKMKPEVRIFASSRIVHQESKITSISFNHLSAIKEGSSLLRYKCLKTKILLVFTHVVNSLTNRFHVAVRLFSNTSQMTSKCGKNKKVAHEAIAECVTDVLTTF